ncbi:MAG TPA: BBE domain-containing protein, partial [Ktedonobacterales bacterium]|nr:BBE domain-containing protein [Ktedonobacterales bacterium]
LRYYEKGSALPRLTDDAIDAIVAAGDARTSPLSQIIIQHMHGAATRVDPTATAYSLRQEQHIVGIFAGWVDGPDEPHVAWTRKLWETLRPYALDGVYINFLGPQDGAAGVRASYGQNFERLVQVKNRYDPTNFFHINHNIPPTIGR